MELEGIFQWKPLSPEISRMERRINIPKEKIILHIYNPVIFFVSFEPFTS
jgi:hypothetical protein